MHHFSIRMRWVFLSLILLGSLAANASAAVYVRGILWDPAGNRLRCTIHLQSPIKNDYKDLVAERGLFYVDLFNVQMAEPLEKELYELNNPFLKAVRFQVYDEQNVLRVHFWPQSGVKHEVRLHDDPPQLIVDFETEPAASLSQVTVPTPKPALQAAAKAPPKQPDPPQAAQTNPNRARTAQPPLVAQYVQPASLNNATEATSSRKIVIIDPGHGGSRAGATGSGVKEKDVNFAISRRLAGLIKNSPNMQYVMTRTSDKHVDLGVRRDFAENIAKGGNGECLFVSIHNNWSSNKSARGIEFYYLEENPKKKSEAVRELERIENDEAYDDNIKGNSTLKNIVYSLVQEKLLERKAQGQNLCNLLEWSFNRHPYFRQNMRSPAVKGAGFVVLRNADMPSVLVEVGFMSNPEECRMLTEEDFQYNAAVGIFNAINAYFKHQDPAFEAMQYSFR